MEQVMWGKWFRSLPVGKTGRCTLHPKGQHLSAQANATLGRVGQQLAAASPGQTNT